jgi:hypothetical protein
MHRHTRASVLGALVLAAVVHVFPHAVLADGRDRPPIACGKEGLPWNRTTGQ